MADIDMIPRSYRDGLRVRRTLAGYGAALLLLLVAGAGGAGVLHWRVGLERPRLDALRAATAQAENLRAQLALAQSRKAALEGATQALAALRGAGAVTGLARALDASLNDRVWFEHLEFSRTQELLRDPLPSPLPPGTLQTAAPGAAGALQAWHLASHVRIAGQALGHGALTGFLDAMSANPALADVRFLNSSATSAGGQAGLAFSAAGSLRPAGGTQ